MSILKSFMLGKMQMLQCFILPLIHTVIYTAPSGWRSKYSVTILLCQCRWISVCFVSLQQHLVSIKAGSQPSCGSYSKLRMHAYELPVSLRLARSVHSPSPNHPSHCFCYYFYSIQHLRGLQMKCL